MDLCIIDTDILSEILKQRNQSVIDKAAAYLQLHKQFTISAISRFEVLRGYKVQNATKQVERFLAFCNHSMVLPVTEKIFDRAADLWTFARQNGHPCADADILIAATAIESQCTLISGNTAHFHWVPDLKLDDWRKG